MEITITKEELGGRFYDNEDCPLARTAKKILNRDDIQVGFFSISSLNYDTIATISPPFEFDNYLALTEGRIESFTTELTLIES